MSLIAFGLNHKTAPVDVRERIAFGPERMSSALEGLIHGCGAKEAAIVSTCNRTEIYTRSECVRENLVEWLAAFHKLPPEAIAPYVYDHRDELAIRHLMRVACGLDSMVLGEPQILGQIKDAFTIAQDAQALGPVLSRLFQHTFSVAKQVRTDTQIGASPVSVAFAAVSLAKQIFGDLSQKTALLIGAGETIELCARHLQGSGLKQVIVANRSIDRAHHLAEQFGGLAIGLTDIPAHLHKADVVISSTASPLPVLGKGAVEQALKQRKRRPIFMVDIAVPRDIEPQVSDLQDVYLYTVDDLKTVIDEGQKSRAAAAEQAEEIISLQVGHFLEWVQLQTGAELIKSYRRQSEQSRDDVLFRAKALLAAGKSPEETLDYLAHTLTNRLIHHPTVVLREACATGDLTAVHAVQNVLGLGGDSPSS
ncbi:MULTISPECIES: glutamyl-tRNA reductase [Halothiobacillus]|jgi:glutamyl-tRNA reductase|uniref:Glutamyl-tRNA reductase n=1 Tax=Halothiobacillus neapolitanus (strain ATCC 23641 / DSM 15147 / CIP 104769 / NCIMB 8539 / c2) TaxID=555778 RepID=D0KZK6_HALNC|nr:MULTISPECIES: glutamyl-tRNA reductase [Halothiobacillus]ACX95879.1 glutamyl-tRNA reductase [Halothiobacillus neapolitanus c2]OZB37242.1 MAG: glutamyl-tRNA reductase [Halothiobacillus sp. 15-55-196]OZB82386.1 MAG: glutamyl-tRNA reductase [Halothiobacillus sp. 13-55-253]TDN66190.1 glutamyl-tRNA reductase [Halothiobacillus neapolitanus]